MVKNLKLMLLIISVWLIWQSRPNSCCWAKSHYNNSWNNPYSLIYNRYYHDKKYKGSFLLECLAPCKIQRHKFCIYYSYLYLLSSVCTISGCKVNSKLLIFACCFFMNAKHDLIHSWCLHLTVQIPRDNLRHTKPFRNRS